MKLMSRLVLVACLVLPFAACKKEEEKPVEAAPVAAPTTDDKAAWQEYINDQVPRHMEGISNQPFVYRVPTNDPEGYDRLLDKAKVDVARGIIKGNLLAYAGADSGKTADFVVEAFSAVTANSMNGVRVVFIGSPADSDRVKTAVEPAGVEYVFVEAK